MALQKDIGYLSAKLEEMHEDIRILNAHVDLLRQESIGRKAVYKAIVAGLGVLASVVVWLTSVVLGISA